MGQRRVHREVRKYLRLSNGGQKRERAAADGARHELERLCTTLSEKKGLKAVLPAEESQGKLTGKNGKYLSGTELLRV